MHIVNRRAVPQRHAPRGVTQKIDLDRNAPAMQPTIRVSQVDELSPAQPIQPAAAGPAPATGLVLSLWALTLLYQRRALLDVPAGWALRPLARQPQWPLGLPIVCGLMGVDATRRGMVRGLAAWRGQDLGWQSRLALGLSGLLGTLVGLGHLTVAARGLWRPL